MLANQPTHHHAKGCRQQAPGVPCRVKGGSLGFGTRCPWHSCTGAGLALGLLRLRHGWSVPPLAKCCGQGTQTMLDFEQARHTQCFGSTLGRFCHALHRHPAQMAALTCHRADAADRQ